MNTDITEVIDIVDSYITLCTLIVTDDSSDFVKHSLDYHNRWNALMNLEKVIPIPTWIKQAPKVSHAKTHIMSQVEGGNGSRERRRRFLSNTRGAMLDNVTTRPRRTHGEPVSQPAQCSTAKATHTHTGGAIKPSAKLVFGKGRHSPATLVTPLPTVEIVSDNASQPTYKAPSNPVTNTVDQATMNKPNNYETSGAAVKKKVFIVHGHAETLKYQVYQFLNEQNFMPIILHHEANDGDTIIEKLERHFNDVSYAVVLYTACDDGKAKQDKVYASRARQNVVFEHGYLISKLGRKNVSALVEDGVETPGDMSGIVYIKTSSDWRYALLRELQKLKI